MKICICLMACLLLVVLHPGKAEEKGLLQLLEELEERDSKGRCESDTKGCLEFGGLEVAECINNGRGQFFCVCKSTATYSDSLQKCVAKSQNTRRVLEALLDLLTKED